MNQGDIQPIYPEAAFYEQQDRLVQETALAASQSRLAEMQRVRAENIEEARQHFNRWSASGFAGALALEMIIINPVPATYKKWFRTYEVSRPAMVLPEGAVEMPTLYNHERSRHLVRYGSGIPVPGLWTTTEEGGFSKDWGTGNWSVDYYSKPHDGILTTRGTLVYATPTVDTKRGSASFATGRDRKFKEVFMAESNDIYIARRAIEKFVK